MQTAALLNSVLQPISMPGALREGTRDLHERIESRLDLAACFASLNDYRALLERYFGLYIPLEEKLADPLCADGWSALGIDFSSRRKADLLRSDLNFLGLTAAEVHSLPRSPASWISLNPSAAELAGYAYVLEGATLGGQIIGRHLEQALGLRPAGPGARFFGGYVSCTGAMWQQFKRAVEAYAAREEAANPESGASIAADAVAAARSLFTGMESWLCP